MAATSDYARYAAPMRELWAPRVVPRTTTPASATAVDAYRQMMQSDPPTPRNTDLDAAPRNTPSAVRESRQPAADQQRLAPQRLRHSKSIENLQKKAQAQPRSQTSAHDQPRPQTSGHSQSRPQTSSNSQPRISLSGQSQTSVQIFGGSSSVQSQSQPRSRRPSNTSSRALSPNRSDASVKRAKSGPLRRTLRKMLSSRPSEKSSFEELPRPSTTGKIVDRRIDAPRPSMQAAPWDDESANMPPLAAWTASTDAPSKTPTPNNGVLRRKSKSIQPSESSLPKLAPKSPRKAAPPQRLSTGLKPSLLPSSSTPSPNSSSFRKAAVPSGSTLTKQKSVPRSLNSDNGSSLPTSPKSPTKLKRQIHSPRRDSLDLTKLPRRSQETEPAAEEGASASQKPQIPQRTTPVETKQTLVSLDDIGSPRDEPYLRPSPRLAMENSSIIARLDELEKRFQHMDVDQIRSKKPIPAKLKQAIAIGPDDTMHTVLPRTIPEETWFGQDSSSADDASGPRTPTSAKEFMDVGMHPVILDDGRDETRREDNAERLLRHSMLQKGHDLSIQRMLAVLATEHNARVALEEEVGIMRDTIASLHRTLQSRMKRDEHEHEHEHEIYPGVPWQQLQSRISYDSNLAGFPANSEVRPGQYAAADYPGMHNGKDDALRARARAAASAIDIAECYYTAPR